MGKVPVAAEAMHKVNAVQSDVREKKHFLNLGVRMS